MDLRKLFGLSRAGEPDTAAEWREKGDTLLKEDRLEDAVASYDRALALDPGDRDALRGKAYATRRIGDFETAKVCYDRIVAQDPEDMRAWLGKGFVHHLDGDPKKAEECYDRVLAKDPRDVTATALKLSLLSERLSREELAAVIREIHAVNPGFFEVYRGEAFKELVLLKLFGNHQEIPVYGSAEMDDSYVTRDMRVLEEALPRIDEASRLMLDDFPVHLKIHEMAGKEESSPPPLPSVDPGVLKGLREQQLADTREWFQKGDNLCRTADHGPGLNDEVRQELYREAVRSFDRVMAQQPGDDLVIGAWLGNGYAALRLARFADALSLFEQALSIAPEDAACWRGKAFALSNLGRAKEAVQCFEKVRAIEESTDPHHALWITKRLAGYVQGQLSR